MNSSLLIEHFRSKDPVIESLIEMHGPITLPDRRDYFNSIVHSIVSQQISTKAADAIYKKFLSKFSNVLDPKIILNTSVEELREIGLSKQKCSYVHDLSRTFLEQSETFAELENMSDEEIVKFLTQIKGIGVWTAQMFLIFTLNRRDVFPIDDFGIKKAMSKFYNLSENPMKPELKSIADEWRPYRSTASLYLWRSLDN